MTHAKLSVVSDSVSFSSQQGPLSGPKRHHSWVQPNRSVSLYCLLFSFMHIHLLVQFGGTRPR
jgi:hypothetical protein